MTRARAGFFLHISVAVLVAAACSDGAGPKLPDAGDSQVQGGRGGASAANGGHGAGNGGQAGQSGSAAGQSGTMAQAGRSSSVAGQSGSRAQAGQGGQAGQAAGGQSGSDDIDAGTDDNDGGPSGSLDGSYACRGKQPDGDSCSDPLVDSAFSAQDHWTLDVNGDQLTLTSVGFDQTDFGCRGQWSGRDFQCDAAWTRAGRECPSTLHLHQENDATLTFWINGLVDTRAGCSK